MVIQPSLFDGDTYEPKHDHFRLTTLLGRVFDRMKDGRWRTLAEIKETCGGSEAAISARLRDYRKEKFGAYRMEARRRGEPGRGLWEYRLLPPMWTKTVYRLEG